jgi:hypothetical protein
MGEVKIKKGSSDSFVRFGLYVAFISLLIFLVLLIKNFNIQKKVVNITSLTTPTPTIEVLSQKDVSNQWEKYTDTVFGFSLLYPGLLVKRIINNSEEYLHFVRFEENTFSASSDQKGIAVGISDRGLGDEVVKIKKEMMDSEGDLTSEKEIKFMGKEAVCLDFEPKDVKKGEERVVVVFFRDGKSYSISTVPGQIERVLEGFKFL